MPNFRAEGYPKKCLYCKDIFVAKHPSTKFCSPLCDDAWHQNRKARSRGHKRYYRQNSEARQIAAASRKLARRVALINWEPVCVKCCVEWDGRFIQDIPYITGEHNQIPLHCPDSIFLQFKDQFNIPVGKLQVHHTDHYLDNRPEHLVVICAKHHHDESVAELREIGSQVNSHLVK